MNDDGPVVITGASGMIGASLARRCLADGMDVHVLTRSTDIPARLLALRDNARVHHIYWNDARALRALFNAIGPRTVFHLAGMRFASSGESLRGHLSSAVETSAQLIDALSDLPNTAVVYASSGAVYGARVGAAESTPAEPASWLGVTKRMAEELFAAQSRMHGRPVVTLRLFTPFGPDDDPDRLIASVLRAAANGLPLALTTGNQTRDYVFIDDVVEAFLLSASLRPQQPEIFNIGSGQARSVRVVVELILRRLGRPELARFGARAERPGDIDAMQAHVAHAAERLRWAPRFTFADGVERTIGGSAKRYLPREVSAQEERLYSR